MIGGVASLSGAKIRALEKEGPRFMLAVGAGSSWFSGGTGGKGRVPSAAPAQLLLALWADGEKGFCLCMGKAILTACATAKRATC